MSERFSAALGRKLVSRESAEELGPVTHIIVNVKDGKVTSVTTGKGRKAALVDWENIGGFGPDAVIVAGEGAVRPPRDDRERAAVEGKLELVGKRVLSDTGDSLGEASDVVFDPESGAVETLVIGEREVPASALLGVGSYALVVKAPAE
ncbi:MAG TPA: PRC-barrel domain-containing protein [Solirubrobacteraceae bacterium]|nr:PRC-barrel domain-containing protein [Solirubrobacteraceae bacterium]